MEIRIAGIIIVRYKVRFLLLLFMYASNCYNLYNYRILFIVKKEKNL